MQSQENIPDWRKEGKCSKGERCPTKVVKIKNLKKLPVTVLSGFLGSGKTTLLKNILRNKRDMKVAVIVNDMSELNLDAKEVQDSKLLCAEEEMITLENGCACCTLRGDLLKKIALLCFEQQYDYLVIELTGIAEPMPIAQTFTMNIDRMFDVEEEGGENTEEKEDDENDTDVDTAEFYGQVGELDLWSMLTKKKKKSLIHYANLDTMVTVVDCSMVFDIMTSLEKVSESMCSHDEENDHEKSLCHLMINQIEFANVILLNKCDLLGGKNSSKVQAVSSLLHKLNPKAKLHHTVNSEVDLSNILNTKLFDMEKMMSSAGWMNELSEKDFTTDNEKYGVSSFIFRSRVPFHPQRLSAILDGFGRIKFHSNTKDPQPAEDESDNKKNDGGPFFGVIRSKGILWIANGYSYPFNFHTAGREIVIEPRGIPFLASIPEEEMDNEEKQRCTFLKQNGDWDEKVGDRENEIVCIGIGIQERTLMAKLKAACLTKDEINKGPGFWKSLDDPFFGGEIRNYFDFAAEDGDENEDDSSENPESHLISSKRAKTE